jgi:putative heme-binding domain-containing protein
MDFGTSRHSGKLKGLGFVLLLAPFIPASLLSQNAPSIPPALLQNGSKVSANNCSGCHGADTFGTDHAPKLTGDPNVRKRSVEQLRSLLESGIPAAGMPAFASLPPQQLDAVAAYVHSLNAAASQAMVPGNASAGSEFFWGEGNCGGCHMVHGRGSNKGPDLSDVGSKMTLDEMHTVLLHPDRHITANYELVTVTLRNGKELKGFAKGGTNFGLQLQDLDGVFHLLQSHEIARVADPWSDRDDRNRPGDNLFTDCVLALNPHTGALKWYFQFTPHDTEDRDATEPPVLVDTMYYGKPRKLLLHADRNGCFYVFDRTNGELLLTKTFLHRVNSATGIGTNGRPELATLPASASNRERGCPDNAANWSSPAFSPTTRLYYLMTLEDCHEIQPPGSQPATQAAQPSERYMRAIHIDTNEVAWEIPQTGPVILKTWSGVLATAGGLVIFGDPNGAFVAVDERKENTLWRFDTNVGMKASPMTFMVDGKQFVAVAAGSVFLCFGLPSE